MSRPSVEVFQEALRPFMESVFKTAGNGRKERWLAEANKRLLGEPAHMIESPGGVDSNGVLQMRPTVYVEASGLHKYHDNHLQCGRDFLGEAVAELLDAIILAGPICQQRLELGLEHWGVLKRRFVKLAIGHAFKALDLLDDARSVVNLTRMDSSDIG